jgi:plastocyanin
VELAVKMTEYAIEPKELTVPLGATVKLTITDAGTRRHDFNITGAYDVQSKVLGAGETQVLTFTADKAGVFQIFCSQTGHKDKGMTATLTIK